MWPLNFARVTRIGLPEFATESAREYFRVNKEKMIGESFDAALARTEADKVVVEAMLASLPALSLPSRRDNRLSWDDVMIFPMLRCLTLIRDLKLPALVRDYLEEVSQLTGVDLYFDRAI
jgi:glutaredoxin 2